MIRADLAGVALGDGHDVAVMGALNVSPESFYAGSVALGRDRLLATAEAMATAGAALLDIGAMSTAPYLEATISAAEEADRLGSAVELLVGKLGLPVSADTTRSVAARAALEAGARVINDVTGLTGDPDMASLVARRGPGVIVMAWERGESRPAAPIHRVLALVEESLGIAHRAGIPPERIVVDPGIGFFRREAMPWHEWDCRVLAALPRLRALGHPVCVGVSRKSFIGALSREADPAGRLPGSLAATTAAVLGGAHLVRSHDVAETVQAVRVAQAICRMDREP